MQYAPAPARCAVRQNVRIGQCRVSPHPAVASTPQCVDQSTWNKAEYHAYFGGYLRRFAALRGNGASEEAIEKFMLDASRRQAALLAKNQPLRRVAAFQGANGYAQGM